MVTLYLQDRKNDFAYFLYIRFDVLYTCGKIKNRKFNRVITFKVTLYS